MLLGQSIFTVFVIYYKSLRGRRQVAKPPKIMCVIPFYFGSVLALFYRPNNLQWTDIHDVAKFDAVPL